MPACKQGYVYVGCSPAFLLRIHPKSVEKHFQKTNTVFTLLLCPKTGESLTEL